MKKHTQSNSPLIEFLMHLFPSKMFITSPAKKIDDKVAKMLFTLWKDDKNVFEDKKISRPVNVSMKEIDDLSKAGLVKDDGDVLEITDKGAEVIKTMILGDERSSFEDDGDVLEFKKAISNIKVKVSKSKKIASKIDTENNWYQKLRNQ